MPHGPVVREHSLDAARGILMSLGILLHASKVYSVAGDWVLANPQRNIVFDLLAHAIHVFRMPTFFWISGYFVGMTFERAGWQGLLRRRLQRIVVPLLVTWITLNVVQEIVLAFHENRSRADRASRLSDASSPATG